MNVDHSSYLTTRVITRWRCPDCGETLRWSWDQPTDIAENLTVEKIAIHSRTHEPVSGEYIVGRQTRYCCHAVLPAEPHRTMCEIDVDAGSVELHPDESFRSDSRASCRRCVHAVYLRGYR